MAIAADIGESPLLWTRTVCLQESEGAANFCMMFFAGTIT